jgi:DNA-binding SARP family transcriptional activator
VVASSETSDSSGLEFCILGPLSIRDGERVLALGSRKQRTLLASLLLHPNERVSLDHLANELWGERPPATAVHTLHVHVSALRKALGDAERRTLIVTCPDGYKLSVEPEQLDSSRFAALAAGGRAALTSGDAGSASAALTEALALWRGRPLADVELEGLDRIEVERLAELRITTLEERIDADLALGRHAQLVGEIEALVAEFPLREGLRAQLMTALARSGRHAEALAVYQDARRTLVDELGLEPSPTLRELESAILRHDPSLTAALPKKEPLVAAILPAGRNRRAALALAVLTALALTAGVATAFLVGGDDGKRTTAAPQNPASTTTRPPVTVTVSSRPQAHNAAAKHGHASGRPRPAAAKHVVASPVADATTSTASRPVHHVTPVPSTPKPARTNVTTTQPPPKVTTFSDDFEDGVRNVSMWHEIITGTNVDVVEQNGSLEIGIAAGATPGGQYNLIDGHYGTMCTFPGDFDARVEYRLLNWPVQSGVYLALNAFFANAMVERWSQSAEEGGADPFDVYGSWIEPHFLTVNTNDQQGSLRLRRKNGMVTSYFLSTGQWRPIDSERRTGAAVMGIQLAANQGVSVQKTVRVAFDNFSLSGAGAICP